MRIDVKYVAQLARLQLTQEQIDKFQRQFKNILEYVEKLKEVNTDEVLPLSHAVSIENVFRTDEVKPSLSPEEALNNAPRKKGNFFKVPKVIK